MQNRSLFLFSFIAITVLQGYVLQKVKIKDQMIAVKPQTKVSPIIRLRHVVIKKPKLLPKVEPIKEEMHPKPPKPVVKKVVTIPKKIKKKTIKKIIKKKKVIKKKRIIKKATKKPINKKAPTIKSVATKKKVPKEKIQKRIPRLQSSSPKQKTIKNNYLAKVRSTIEHRKKYPRTAKRLRQQGVVIIGFTIYKNGHIGDIKLVKKSSYAKLNHAAIKILKRIGAFSPIPKDFRESSISLTVPIRYKILN